MDVYYSEKSLYGGGRIEAALDSLRAKDLIYEGVLEPPKGMKFRRIGSRASRRCSARPPMATTSTGR